MGKEKRVEFGWELPTASVKCLWNKRVCICVFLLMTERGGRKRASFVSGEELFYTCAEEKN